MSVAAVVNAQASPDAAGFQAALTCLEAGRHFEAEGRALLLADRRDAPQPRAWIIVAAARRARSQHASAAEAYRMFLASCTDQALRRYVVDQITQCEIMARRGHPFEPPSKSLGDRQLQELSEVADQTFIAVSEHFTVRSRNSQLSRIVAEHAERTLARICRVLLTGQEYPHTVEIHIWPDRQEYLANAADAPEWSGGSFSTSIEDGLVVRRIDLTQRDSKDRFATIMLDRVLGHELCHLVVHEYFGDAACPLFLNEGLAMLAESEVDNDRLILAGAALASDVKLPLESLLVRSRQQDDSVDVFYAESLSFVHYLQSRLTPAQFAAMLAHVKAGCDVVDALQRSLYIGSSESFFAELEEAWREHAITHAQYIRALHDQK